MVDTVLGVVLGIEVVGFAEVGAEVVGSVLGTAVVGIMVGDTVPHAVPFSEMRTVA